MPDKKKPYAKKELFSNVFGYESKELDSQGNFIVSGLIATTHLDSGWYDTERDTWVRDRIAPETLQAWAAEINAGNPRANKASINHVREKVVAGVGIKDSASVVTLTDGEKGLFVKTLVDKTKENFDVTKYRVDNGLLDSFSIEYMSKDPMTGEYLPGAVKEEKKNEGIIRTLLPATNLEGWTLASQPMNEYAIMIKEIFKSKEIKEEIIMTETKTDAPVVLEHKEAPLSAEQAELIRLGKEAKEKAVASAKVNEMQEFKTSFKKELISELKQMEPEKKVKADNPEKEMIEFKEFKESLTPGKMSVSSQVKIAGKLSDKLGFTAHGEISKKTSSVEQRIGKYQIEIKESPLKSWIEFKGLGVTTNQNTDTDYLQSTAELSDVYDPVIYNALYQPTVTWNLLRKEDYSNKGNNQVQFALKTAANTTAAAYTGNAVNTGVVTRLKFQTKFKKYAVGVEVDGDTIAAARGGPIGDVFGLEVADSTVDLLQVMNQALFANVGLETAAGVIGFAYITNQASNTTLFNLTRSTANKLNADAAADIYINGNSADVDFANLRNAVEQARKEGALMSNLVFITHMRQANKIKQKLMAMQRYVPTSGRVGFEGMLDFDGIPVFEDKDCTNTDIWLVDLETHKIAIWVPPTLEMLGKDADSQKGFIKCYWATFNRAPRRLVQIYSNAT